ncbi:bifunctional nitrate reductase/sulfite reductase flavoprotein subunit alpha [Acinetobacter sp. ANC 3926]|uniref:Sulfite reductase [NADPH] flavoprotein, alpha-component n=1 Tax=Acinetobacter genomosp. 15BJ TaxID=106651 RepID=R9AZE9_9GAMM|nr:bifunctional nitrate reductase/sulfite reductase flavoprotein subunit alpha [Acinetobacter genomosp. 15BJ]EOR07629.1 sulfite reductase [NADPH] flavoprotein, alpha-component [Acinetobacter genomosp. 15BJ]MCH7292191.1 bifunctional nitrate reductase/sulfite reductase flavoprotein subunit alpha [Acinetobacter genomosp. 15BJ]
MADSIKTVCPYCGVGCGMVLQVENGQVVKLSGDKEHPTNYGRLCTKGSSADKALRNSGRMEKAYVRKQRTDERVAYTSDLAITQTAQRLRQIIDRHGPNAVSFYVSGQMSIEAQYLINKLSKGFIGTNNIESNSRLCMASAGSGYKLSLGADGPPGSYQDFDHADVFFVIGANMADCHPILFLRLMDRVKAGAKLIVVDPRRNATADKAHLFMQIKPGTDLILLNGLLHLLCKNNHLDHEFIQEYTEGWEQMPEFLDEYTPAYVANKTGIEEEKIRQAAQWMGEAKEFMSCWTMGLNQSTHGTWNTNAICNLHLATGKICRLGSGPFSLTGQPNAMGGREMGYMGPGLPGQRSVLVEKDRDFIEELWHIPKGTLSTNLGKGTIDMFERMKTGEIKACWIICTNPVATVANRKTVIEALEAAELVITQDAFLDTETNRYADIMLPAALWAEAEGVMINSERNMTLMQKAIEPPGDALADWQIISRIACEMGYVDAFSYSSASEIFDEICLCSNPKTGYDLRGASHARLKETPLQWPCPPLDQPNGSNDRHPIRYLNDGISQKLLAPEEHKAKPRLIFPTERTKGVFFARPHLDPAEMPDQDFPFVLNTGRLQHQWHTMTKTGKIPMLNKLNAGPFVEIHPEDAANLNIKDKQSVEIRSRRGKAVLPAVVTDRVLAGNCFAPFHWNDFFGEDLAINAVTNDAIDPISQQPEFKVCAVSLTPVAPTETLLVAEALKHQKSTVQNSIITDTADSVAGIFQSTDMSKLNVFATSLGIETVSPPCFDDAEKIYLAGFIAALQSLPVSPNSMPTLPMNAPISDQAKLWLNGMLAGLYSRAPLNPHELALSKKTEAQKPKITLLWASQTGNSENLAEGFSQKIKQAGYDVNFQEMSNFSIDQLEKTDHLLCISSTFGDGDAPDNGQNFWSDLTNKADIKLDHLNYSVLALGDPNYDQFCGHGKKLDQKLAELGASRIFDRIDCDTDFQEKAEQWLNTILNKLAESTKIKAPPSPLKPQKTDLTAPSKTNPFHSRLVQNVRLNHEHSNKDIRLFAFDIENSGITYEAGDALGIWPQNCPEIVNELLSVTKLAGDSSVSMVDLKGMTLRQALTERFEIAKPQLNALKLIATKGCYQRLQDLLDYPDKSELKKWLWGKQLVDVLHEFPIKLSVNELISILPKLQPRLYSIASSPKTYPTQIHLTVSAVRYDYQGNVRKGVSSTFLADRAEQCSIPIFVQKSASFHPPIDSEIPLIMVGPGTGIAPFRGFLQERQALGKDSKNWLFFGEQQSSTDFYYQEELKKFQNDGVLTRLDLAFSRDQDQKIYVQDRMREQGAELWQWLEQGAYFCICGDASRMAKDVDAVLKEIIVRHGNKSEDEANTYVSNMSRDKRYLRDVY